MPPFLNGNLCGGTNFVGVFSVVTVPSNRRDYGDSDLKRLIAWQTWARSFQPIRSLFPTAKSSFALTTGQTYFEISIGNPRRMSPDIALASFRATRVS